MTITFLTSPFFTPGRQGAKITDIVLHWMDLTLSGTDAEFQHGTRRVSAHYGIEDTTVHQYVADADTAWHAGDWTENTKSIGIELSAAPGRDASPATIATSVALMVTLCREYGISPDHIYPHNKFTTTECPGTLPLAAMIAAVQEGNAMRTMYDAVTPANIPTTAQMVAGYIDGLYKWKATDWARFPHSVKVQIAVFPSTNAGVVLDCERGDATPAQCPGWVVKRRAAGVDPTVYCSLSAWSAVKTAFHNAGVTEPHYWIAAYPGNGANLYPGSVAHQYADPGPVDLSVVADYWPGVDPKPAPLPGPASPIPHVLGYTSPVRGPFPLASGKGYTTGSRGWGVNEIQTLTGATPVDGQFGPITAAHVAAWTKAHGPYPTAVVNKQVWDQMCTYAGK